VRRDRTNPRQGIVGHAQRCASVSRVGRATSNVCVPVPSCAAVTLILNKFKKSAFVGV
jgi:hypothetical protein